MSEILAAIEKQGVAFEEFKKANDAADAARKAGEESRARELNEKVDRINTDLTKFGSDKKKAELELQAQRDRIEELEARVSSPGATAMMKRSTEHTKAFGAWLRNPTSTNADALQQVERKLIEAKDITIGTPAAGGYALPEEISREIGRLELLFSPVRSLVKVVQAGTNDYKELVSIRGATSGWVGETGTRTATLTPQLRERAPTFGELYAYPQISEWATDDIFFNVEQWLAEEVAQRFAVVEGLAVISGSGTNQPTGFLNTSPVATADFASPARSANAYQLVTSDLTPGGVGIIGDALIDTVYTLNSEYRSGATWVMNSLTIASTRKVKDTTGQYLWQPGLAMGQPETLLGYPVAAWEQMPAIAANAFVCAFGNWRRGYVLAERVGLRITRDNVTNVGYIRFYVRRREGGHVLDNHSIKVIQVL